MKVQNNFCLWTGLLFVITGVLWLGEIDGWFQFGISGSVTMLALGMLFLCIHFTASLYKKFNCWISSLDINENNYFGQ